MAHSVTADGLRIVGDEEGLDGDCHRERYWYASNALPAESRVLDYGAGTGYGVAILSKRHVACGYEPDPVARAFAIDRWGVELLDSPSGSYDAVTCFEVLEHLKQHPADTLRHLLTLAPKVIASVPYKEMPNTNPHHAWSGMSETIFSGIKADFRYQYRSGMIGLSPKRAQNLIIIASE